MSNTKAYIVIGLFALVALLGLGWIFQGNDFFLYRFFAPRYEAVRRQTYEQTKSYRQGSVQRLGSLCDTVAESDADHKAMIQDQIKHEFAEWNASDLPAYLQGCLSAARGEQQ